MTKTPVGLYSIGIRGIDVEELLAVAAHHLVPFLHLRGGSKGFDVVNCPRRTLAGWADQARDSCPITVVTADLDVGDFLRDGRDAYLRACAELHRLAEASVVLGAAAVRLIGRRVPDPGQWSGLAVPDLAGCHGMTALVELHDAAWFTPQMVDRAVSHLNGCSLLVDSAQVHEAWLRHHDATGPLGLGVLASRTGAVHLSDNGGGMVGAGHRMVADVFGGRTFEQRIEVAFEWTGPDRSVDTCLARYRHAVEWWHGSMGVPPWR